MVARQLSWMRPLGTGRFGCLSDGNGRAVRHSMKRQHQQCTASPSGQTAQDQISSCHSAPMGTLNIVQQRRDRYFVEIQIVDFPEKYAH